MNFERLAMIRSPRVPDYRAWVARWRLMWERIGGAFPQNPKRVLDIGAGQGWSLEYLKRRFPSIEIVAIERSPVCREHIKTTVSARVVDVDVEDDWPKDLDGRFDRVISRHTLEHLRAPGKALEKLRRALAPGGRAYIVVPNLAVVRRGRRMRTDFFRPIHLHYFSSMTFVALAGRAGLSPERMDSGGEIWGLFHAADQDTDDACGSSDYLASRSLLRERLRQSLFLDWKQLLRMRARQLLRKFG